MQSIKSILSVTPIESIPPARLAAPPEETMRKVPPHFPAVLALGVAGQIGQILLLRELLMVFHGNELSIGIILAAWMAWVGVGSRCGAALADRSRRPLGLLAATAAALAVFLPATVLLVRGLRGFFDVVPGAYLSFADMAVSCAALMAPACLLFGAQFVLLARIWREKDGTLDTVPAGKAYSAEAVGNILGGVLFTFVLVHHANAFQQAVLAAALMPAALLWLEWRGRNGGYAEAGQASSLSQSANVGQASCLSAKEDSCCRNVAQPPPAVRRAEGPPRRSDGLADEGSPSSGGVIGALVAAVRRLRRRAQPGAAVPHSGQAGNLSYGRFVLWGVLAVSAVAFPFLGLLDAWAYRMQWRFFAPEHELVETRQSKYGTIAVLRREDQHSFFQSGHLAFSTGGDEPGAAALEELEGAVFAHFALAQHREPRRVLLLGGGMRGTLREMVRHPVERIDYVELDEALTDAARAYAPRSTVAALEDPRVRLIHADGRLFAKASREEYDMVVVDAPDPATAVLNRFYTEEFFREAKARLAPGGVFVISAVSTADLRGMAVANRNATIYHTLKAVFGEVLPAGERALFFFATDEAGQVSADVRTLMMRYVDRGVQTGGFSPGHFATLLQETPLRRKNWILRHHGREPGAHLSSPETGPLFPGSLAEQAEEEKGLPPPDRRYFVNTDFRPIGYYYTLMFWHVLSRGERGEGFLWLLRVQPWWAAPPAAAALAVALLLKAGRRRWPSAGVRFAVLLAVFTTGLSTMALQIALMFAFQSIYGFVYEMVGLIVAMFMAGLALGAAASNRFVPDKSDVRVLMAVQLLVAVFAALIGLGLPWAASAASPGAAFAWFSALTFFAGLLNGADFPLATGCCLALTRRPEKSTGTVYGVELFGACAGALLASVAVAPVLGIVACCFLAAIANGVAFAALLVCGRVGPCGG